MTVPQNVLKSRKSFTYVSPDVFLVSTKSLIINILQDIVRVSFSALRGIRKGASFRFMYKVCFYVGYLAHRICL